MPVPEERNHPFANSTVTVRIDNNSETDHDIEANAREALEFWEVNSQQYVEFEIEFDVVTESNPDMLIVYADDPSGCENVPEFSAQVLGCAPLLRPDSRFERPATARVVAAARPFGKVRITTKHEIGHILGLGHEDEPRSIMSNRPEDRIPMYEDRIAIWELVLEMHELTNEATRLFNHGTVLWNDGIDDGAAETFGVARDDYETASDAFEAAHAATDEFEGHPRVETVALEELRDLLGVLARRAEAAHAFSGAMAEAARARETGDSETATARIATANQYIREFNDIEMVELRQVAMALGLVRGFDREEPVVGDDEEEI